MRVRCAIAIVGTLGLTSCPASALAGSGDTATTNAYLQADYALVKTVSAQLPRSQAALLGLLAHVRQSCPLAAISSPQDSQSTQLSDELIGAMVLSGGHVDRQAVRAYTTKVNGLRWSNQEVNREIHSHVSDLQTLLGLPVPDICADVKSWASSGFKVLAARTVQFAATFMEGWVRPGNQPAQLASSEGSYGRALAQRAEQVEWRITDFESEAVETWGAIMDALVLSP